MTENKKRLIRCAYAIFLAVFTVIVGVLFIVQIQAIYHSADKNPYTTASVSEHFKQISAAFYAWIVAALGGGVIACVLPEEKSRPKAYVQTQITLTRLQSRLSDGGKSLPEVRKQTVFRWVLRLVCLALCVVSAVFALVILLGENYTPKFTSEFFTGHRAVVDRLVSSIPWIVAAFAAAGLVALLAENSRKKQVRLLKAEYAAIKAKGGADKGAKGDLQIGKKRGETLSEKACEKFPFLRSRGWAIGVRAFVAAAGVVLVIVGIFDGGMRDVLMKAINICTQCIGLG